MTDSPDRVPVVQLVVMPYGLHAAYVDEPERADQNARAIGGVVVTLPATADHRTPPGAQR